MTTKDRLEQFQKFMNENKHDKRFMSLIELRFEFMLALKQQLNQQQTLLCP